MTSDPSSSLPAGQGPQEKDVPDHHPTGEERSPPPVTTPAPPARPTPEGVPIAHPVAAGPADLIPTLPYATPVQRMPMLMSRIRAVVELILLLPAGALGAGAAHAIVSAWPLSDPRWSNIADGFGMGFGCVLACALLLRLAGHGLVTIGWTTRQFAANVGVGLAALLITYVLLTQVTMAAVMFYPELLAEPSAAQKAIEETFPPMTFWSLLLMSVFVALWEEVVFRGFVLTRFQALLRRWWLTVPITSAAFGLLHFYEGPLAMILITTLALVMGTLFVWRKSLVPSMMFHLVHNVVIFQLLRSVSATWQ